MDKDKTPKRMIVLFKRVVHYARMFPTNFLFWPRFKSFLRQTSEPFLEHDIADDFFGVNIAPGPTSRHDDFVISRLKELGLKSIRIDYGYSENNRQHACRLINQVSAEGFRVLLHLVQPPNEAFSMGNGHADRQWREFLEKTLDTLGENIAAVEIGSAVNRFTWSRYTTVTYARAATIAHHVCRHRGIPWYGANVTDFSPLYNVDILFRLRGAGVRPDVHTDNLFVDRAGQPENSDSHVAGRWSERIRTDLVGKARCLLAIGRHFGIDKTISSYCYWTLNSFEKQKPRYVSPERASRYLVRYFVLAAASGYLSRVYWGQMVSHCKGLIDDGSGYQPETPTVHHMWSLEGDLENYKTRPAFRSFAIVVARLRETRFIRRIPTMEGTYLFEFLRRRDGGDENETRLLVGWTCDGLTDSVENYLSEIPFEGLRIENIYGERINAGIPAFSESPIYLSYSGKRLEVKTDSAGIGDFNRFQMPPKTPRPFRIIHRHDRRIIFREDVKSDVLLSAAEDPESLFSLPDVRLIKDSRRGCLMEVALLNKSAGTPEADGYGIYKRFNPSRQRTWAPDSRAFKTWNSACEILRRNIPTAAPLVLIEELDKTGRNYSYIAFEKILNTVQLLSMLYAFRHNEAPPLQIERKHFFRQLGHFVQTLHAKGVFHRDLSGGNILIRQREDSKDEKGHFDFWLIDISRARFFRRINWMYRHWDLARIRIPKQDLKDFYLAYHKDSEWHCRRYWRYWRLITFLYRVKYNLKPSRLKSFLRKMINQVK